MKRKATKKKTVLQVRKKKTAKKHEDKDVEKQLSQDRVDMRECQRLFPIDEPDPMYSLTGPEFREALEKKLSQGHPIIVVNE